MLGRAFVAGGWQHAAAAWAWGANASPWELMLHTAPLPLPPLSQPGSDEPATLMARFLHNHDPPCKRWLNYPYYWGGGSFEDVNGPCFGGMYDTGAFISKASVSSREEGPCNSTFVADGQAPFRTSTTCSATGRLKSHDAKPFPLNMFVDFPNMSARGCEPDTWSFFFNTWGNNTCVPAYATPSIEVLMGGNEYMNTYL